MNKNHNGRKPVNQALTRPSDLADFDSRQPATPKLYVHPFVWAFLGLVTFVAMASVIAAVAHP